MIAFFSIKKAASISEMQIQYDTERRIHKIKQQESSIALLDTKNTIKNQLLFFGSVGLLAVFGFIVLYRAKNTAKKRQQLQEQFSEYLIVAQEQERLRVSKELHDSVGQQLTLIKKKAQNLEQQELSKMTNNALEEVRSISRNLYPSTLKQLGLTQSIEQLLYNFDENVAMFFTTEIDQIDQIDQNLNKDKLDYLINLGLFY